MAAPVLVVDSGPTGFRARAIRLGIRFSWVGLLLLAFESYRADALGPPEVILFVASGAGLAALSLIRWERVAQRAIGTALLWSWGAIVLLTIATMLSIEQLLLPLTGVAIVSVVFVAVIGQIPALVAFTTAATGLILTAPSRYDYQQMPQSGLLMTVGAFAAVAIVARMLTAAYRREVVQARTSLAALARQEANFERLYEVSRTIAAGDHLANVVPQLVGRIGTYLDAEVGVVLLRDSTGTHLEVLSPIWAAGHSLEVAGYRIGLQSRDPIADVYRKGEAQIFTSMNHQKEDHGLLGELGLSSALAAPLRVEGRSIGLIVVGDRRSGSFSHSELEDLISLAAPAALVLAQLDRYQEAAETSRRMEELARMKTDFVSVVSHELRTPLTSIIGSLATLARPELAPERPAARELLTSARNQADRLRRLIEDLLMVSRIENRALPQQPGQIKLEVLLRDVVATIPKAGDLVTILVDDDVNEIEADPDHLQRIVINLIENAVKYAPGSPIEVIAAPAANQTVAISILDHGPGIPAEARTRAFERFQQLEPSATRSQGGTGLGLNIVRGLVNGMGGRIELSETAGGGATFTILLPKAPGSLSNSAVTIV